MKYDDEQDCLVLVHLCLIIYLLNFMYQVMGEYGYSIEHILMVDIIPDPAVRKAMNEINAGNIYYTIFRAFF